MAKTTAYLFCRYQILQDDFPLTAEGEWEILNEIIGKMVPYRKREPSSDDFDTYLMRPRKKAILGKTVHTWSIAQQLRFRERSTYDKARDDVTDDMIETDEIRHTKFVSVPRLGVFAVDDSISERSLGARSAVNRFAATVEYNVDDSEVRVNFAGTPQDAQRALETWKLEEFSFSVRPFNPTIRKYGQKIHELMVQDHVGSLRAVALPAEGHEMRDSHEGLISEAKGLSEAGYGQYGARGLTPDGQQASLSKPKFSLDKSKNLEAQNKNRTLKVYIEKGSSLEEEEHAIVKALLDLYG